MEEAIVKENGFIIDGIKIPKGNFAFIYDKLGDKDVYQDFLDAERNYRFQPINGHFLLRRAYEGFILMETTKKEEGISGQARPEDVQKLKKGKVYKKIRNMAKDPKKPGFYWRKGVELFTQSGKDYSHYLNYRQKGDEFLFKNSDGDLKIDDFLKRMYHFLSEEVHAGNESSFKKELHIFMNKFYHILTLYYDIKPTFLDFRMPYHEYYPLSAIESDKLNLPALGGEETNRFYAISTDNNSHVFFNIIFRSYNNKETPTSEFKQLQLRQNDIMNVLWGEGNRKDPTNVLRASVEYTEGNFTYKICTLKNRPSALTSELLSNLNFDDRKEILDGICGAVQSMHTYKQPFYHRHICPAAFIACPSGDSYQLCLIRFDFTKDTSGVLAGEVSNLAQEFGPEMEGFVAPEAHTFNKNTADAWAKADIYSMGKLFLYILNGGKLPKEGKELENIENLDLDAYEKNLLYRMISVNPEERPSLKEIINAFG